MSIGFFKQLCDKEAGLATSMQDRAMFYGLNFISPLIWWAELEANQINIPFMACLIGSLLLPLWLLTTSLTGSMPIAAATKLQCFAPIIFSLFWLSLMVLSDQLDASDLLVFILLSVLMTLAAMPFGAVTAFAFSLPILLAADLIILTGPWQDSLRFVVLLNLCFLVFWYDSVRATVDHGQIGTRQRATRLDALLGEVERLRATQLADCATKEQAQSDGGLEAEIAERGRNLELAIRDRTKELIDANTQLNEQIAMRKTIGDALVRSQTRLTQAIDASRLGLIDWDVYHGQFYQSAFHNLFGEREQSSAQVIQTLKQVIHPADYIEVRDTLNACLAGHRMEYSLQYRVKDEQGWFWIEESAKVVETGPIGQAYRILGTRRNIQSEVLRDEQVRLAKSVFDHTSEGVFVLDPNGRFLSVNPAYTKISGRDSGFLLGKTIQEVSETPQKEQVYAQLLQAAAEHGHWQGELLEKRHRGDYYPQWTQINAIYDERGALEYYAGLVSDLSDRQATDQRLNYLLNYDDLTKLANRIQFKDQLHRAMMRYKDEQIGFVLVLLDIDRFNKFNDSVGHDDADQILKAVAERLSKNVQKVDILARVGGNEFACIVACSPTFDVLSFAQRLFICVTQKHYEVAGQEIVLACSIGIARVPEHAQDIETLMQYGALAVQKAKYQGGNRIELFDDSLKSFSRQRLEIEQELRKALNQSELEVHYQPKFDLVKGKITSLEALIRWNHPTRGAISPEEFVNIAEESGLISELGSFVMKTACTQTQLWASKGLGQMHLSVNLSPRQLRETGLHELVTTMLETTQIPAEYLELELTESAIMEDMLSATKLLNEVRQTGVKISIDDFGTGYSSLSYLKELPINTLKIDRAFIEGLETNQAQKAIVKAIIVLGHSLSLQIVAEGVENDTQLELLRTYGCDLIQGYLVSRPINASAMERMLEQQLG